MRVITVSTIIAAICAVLCFLPVYLDMDMEPYIMQHAELQDIAIKTALESTTLKYLLVSSAATMFPFLLQISLGIISDPLSVAYQHIFPKMSCILTVLIVDLVFALALCPFSNYKAVPALFCVRMMFLFCSCVTFISSYPCKAWTPIWMNTIIGLFSAGQVLSSVGAFAPNENIYSIILAFTLICRITSVLLYCWRLHLWIKYLSNVKMGGEDYMAVSFLTVLISVSLGACWLNIIFSYQHWHNTSATFLSSIIVITSVLVILFILLNEMAFSHEIRSMQMSQALMLKRMLVRYFSHQLRTPLNTVNLGLTLMAKKFEKYNDTDMNDVLEDATQSCKLTLQVLDNMLLYEKLESNKMTVVNKKVMLQPLVQNLTNMIQFQTNEKGINLITEISQNTGMIDHEEVYLLADNNKLNQVLLTILSNAIKYTKARGRVTISLVYTSDLTTSEQIQDARRKEIAVGRVSIVVTDTGCGIAPNRLATLFTENIQFNVGQEETHKGSGLSLWIAKRIVDLHPNMSLEVTSEGVDCGSSFTLSLPFYLSNIASDDSPSVEEVRSFNLESHGSTENDYDGMQQRALTRIDAPELRRAVNNQAERSFRKLFISSVESMETPRSGVPEGQGQSTFHFMRIESRTRIGITPITNDHDSGNRHDALPGGELGGELGGVIMLEDTLTSGSSVRMKSLSALIVDDAKMNRKMICRLLRGRCGRLSEAEDGDMAVTLIRESMETDKSFDFVLMDYQMPVMDGATATKAMRELGFTGPIIGVTGNALPLDIDTFLASGANVVLTKPLDMSRLEEVLTEYAIVLPSEE